MIAFLSAGTRTSTFIRPVAIAVRAFPSRPKTILHHGASRQLLRKLDSRPRSYHSSTLKSQALPGSDDVLSYHNRTIYALSTAPGKAAIAVLRISGPACIEIYQAICPGRKIPKPRTATLRPLYTPRQPPSPDTVLDSGALVLYFPGPKTVTGEDILEFHVHGGHAVVKSVLGAISKSSSSVRYAEPGEFTRRAFFNDRLDLIQVEALGDVLTATTEQQARLALRGTTSGLAKRYEDWRALLLYARGELEALIDFSEDQHFDESPVEFMASVSKQVSALRQQIDLHRANAVRGELLRNGINFALLGAPNVGKSSLLNSVVGREAAIVSSEAGTTRDVVDVGIDLGGWFCKFGDTAGLRRSAPQSSGKQDALHSTSAPQFVGAIEREGMKRAKQRASEADVVIIVCAIEHDSNGKPELVVDPEVHETAKRCKERGVETIVVVNKMDRLPKASELKEKARMKQELQVQFSVADDRVYFISCIERLQQQGSGHDDGGVPALFQGILALLKRITDPVGHSEGGIMVDPSVWSESLGATERHRLLLEECLGHLDEFLTLADPQAHQAEGMTSSDEVDIVVAAENLRAAGSSLARITGRGEGDSEDVLGVVFEKFCVGK